MAKVLGGWGQVEVVPPRSGAPRSRLVTCATAAKLERCATLKVAMHKLPSVVYLTLVDTYG